MKQLNDYIDERGFIHHRDSGINFGSRFGDSAQRTFMNHVMKISQGVRADIYQIGNQYKALTSFGDFRRHWDTNYWPGKEGYGTRDNLFPLMCALTLSDHAGRFELMNKIYCRGGLLWNKYKIGQQDGKAKPFWEWDFVGPLIPLIIYEKTALASKYVRQVVDFRLSAIQEKPDDTTDDLNIQTALLTLQFLDFGNIRPVIEHYCATRPQIPGYDSNMPGYQQAFVNYFNPQPDPNIAPPLDLEMIKTHKICKWPLAI